MDDAAAVSLAHRSHLNMVEAFASLPTHQARGFVRRNDGIVVAATGSPIALFNAVLPVARPVSPGAFAEACRSMQASGLPWTAQLREDVDESLVGVAQELGLEEMADASWPAMVLTSLPITATLPPGLEVDRVTEPGVLEEHLRASGGDPRVTATWKGSGLLGDRRWIMLVGRADGSPIAKAMAFLHDGVVGVYDVATRADARRRGYGSAITAAALAAGRRAGCAIGVLQSSSMARHMYEMQGFRFLFRYRAFRG